MRGGVAKSVARVGNPPPPYGSTMLWWGLCLSVCRRGVGTVVLGCGMGIVLGVGIVGTVAVGFVVCPLCVCGGVMV